ncbi:NlpC/P60 family protein [Photobacterium rosenbergii]|uniref:NlpC/P60 family protein n=1 Tax=Photobacterium rosenbergii TaxID=294936 RepID=A0ABU3ZJP4_9GAMM|nr:NlpC/P60 family protein [Photobacterium rosenbergii]MDV5170244.1 NlpC/P60 family protein [Photobacterium rosenbergii]
MKKQLLSLALTIWLSGCSSSPDSLESDEASSEQKANTPRFEFVEMNVPIHQSTSLDSVYRQWRGTPYRLGGTTKAGIDCSAFVQIGLAEVFQKKLPRTTGEQVRQGKWVAITELEEGDLVFFKTGRTLRHVGIYLGDSQFLHASTSQGVMISNLKNPYWRSTYWQARRVVQ